MTEILERAGLHAHVAPPVVVVLPDPEVRTDVVRPILGVSPVERLITAAMHAGFGGIVLAPGTRVAPAGARELATGEPVDGPALVVFEGSLVHPELLALMVAHPLEPDERYTLYDAVGRPTACFDGHLDHVPSGMPVSEELPWPEHLGPDDVVRLVYDEDLERAEALVFRSQDVVGPGATAWRRHVEAPTLRLLANSRRPLPQIELLGLGLAVLSLPLALWGTHVGMVLAAVLLLLGVHLSGLYDRVRRLRERLQTEGAEAETIDELASGEPVESTTFDDRLARATRPLGHAALMGGLTYVIVAETDRSQVAAVVLLVAGAAAALLSLFQARLLLRHRPAEVFALPDAHAVAARLGVKVPAWVDGAPVLELTILLASLPGVAELPWSVLAAAAVARLWRWFAGPAMPP